MKINGDVLCCVRVGADSEYINRETIWMSVSSSKVCMTASTCAAVKICVVIETDYAIASFCATRVLKHLKLTYHHTVRLLYS